MVVQAEKEEGPIAKFFDFLASLLPIVIIGGLLYAGFFVKGSAVVKKVEPKAIERRDNFYSITAPTDKVAWAVGTGGKIIAPFDGLWFYFFDNSRSLNEKACIQQPTDDHDRK